MGSFADLDNQMKCFGEACAKCKDFFSCPDHWGEPGEQWGPL